jgi:hypothetical protein
MRPCRASVCGLLVGLTMRNRWNIRLPASWPWRWPGFVPDMRVWTDLFGVLFGVAHWFEVVASLLACGGLSDACRRPSSFSLLAQREGTKRNGLWSPPTLQALSVEGLGTDRTLPVRPDGHTAPSPSTEAREGVSRRVALRSLPPGRTVRSGLAGRLPHQYGGIVCGRAPVGNPSRQDIGRTVVGAGRRRFSTDEGLVIQSRGRQVSATTADRRHWIPACAGMTVRGGPRGKNETTRLRWSERSAATRGSHSLASVEGDGAVWPSVEQEVSCLFQPLRATRLVGSAGSIGHFSWLLLFGPAKRSSSGAGRRPKAHRR